MRTVTVPDAAGAQGEDRKLLGLVPAPRTVLRRLGALGGVRIGVPIGDAQWLGLTYALFLVFLGVVLATFRDYGITYDEHAQAMYGDQIISWYATGFRDGAALTFWNLHYLGGFFEVVANLAAHASPLRFYETRHLVTALFGLAGLVGAHKLGTHLGGPRAGFFAALLLALTPRWYGDVFQNPKDVPFAVLHLWSMLYVVRAAGHFPTLPRGLLVKMGIAIGLTLAVRIGGVLLFAYAALAAVLAEAVRRLTAASEDGGDPTAAERIARHFRTAIALGAVAYLAMIPWWPAAQASPILKPLRAIRHTSQFDYAVVVHFDGRDMPSDTLPWWYVPEWLLVTAPEYLLLLAVLAAVLGVLGLRAALRARDRDRLTRAAKLAVLATSAAFPVAFVALRRPVTYDGIRHFLFVVPVVAVLGAVALDALLRDAHRRVVARVVTAAVAGSLALTAADLVRLHPYQYVYFNRLVAGGLPGAAGVYDTDYWGAAHKEGAEWLVANYRPDLGGRRPRVASTLYSLSTSYYLPQDRFRYIGSLEDGDPIRPAEGTPDVCLSTTRWGHGPHDFPGRVLHVVERMGVPLLYVVEAGR